MSLKLEPIRQNQMHFQSQRSRFDLKTIQHSLPFDQKNFLLAYER